MHKSFKWLLQLFAEGGEGAAAATGDTAADAGQQAPQQETLRDRLRARGVPEEMLGNRAYDRVVSEGTPKEPTDGQDAAAAQEQDTPEEHTKPTWKELMKDPDYNAEMNKTVQKRIGKYKGAADAMDAMQEAHAVIAQRYGIDLNAEGGWQQLSEAIMQDDSYFEQRAIELGVPVDVARKLDAADRLEAARQRDAEMSELDRQIRAHRAELETQALELQKTFPDFDLAAEMEDDRFARMLVPGSGLSVEDAYWAVHRAELTAAAKDAAVRNMAKSIQGGAARPNETGMKKSGNAPARNLDSIRHMTPEKRQEIIERVRRGERVTPDMLY